MPNILFCQYFVIFVPNELTVLKSPPSKIIRRFVWWTIPVDNSWSNSVGHSISHFYPQDERVHTHVSVVGVSGDLRAVDEDRVYLLARAVVLELRGEREGERPMCLSINTLCFIQGLHFAFNAVFPQTKIFCWSKKTFWRFFSYCCTRFMLLN